MIPKLEDIPEIISDRKIFENTVYTPLEEALEELKKRQNDKELEEKINEELNGNIPELLKSSPKAVLFRQVVTPNYEVRRFVSIVDAIDELEPLFFEFYQDKFVANNEWKHSLGKLKFFLGKGKKGGAKIDRVNIIDFNNSGGKLISDIKTLFGQNLIDFHHEMFEKTYKSLSKVFFYDASNWFEHNGKTASNYYSKYLTLFIRNGILFENFLINYKELQFTKEVFLPAFFNVCSKLGVKPLIVALEPTDIEDDEFWTCYPVTEIGYISNKRVVSSKSFVQEKMKNLDI